MDDSLTDVVMSRLDKSAVLKETANLIVEHTRWNMNMEPKNPHLEKEKHLPNRKPPFLGSTWFNILHAPKTNSSHLKN